MDRKSLAVLALFAVLAATGVYHYESQLIELRGELEEARLREEQAASALTRLTALRRTEAPALPAKPVAQPSPPIGVKQAAKKPAEAIEPTPAAEADPPIGRQAQIAKAEVEARAATERARQDAEARKNSEPRFHKEPFRPGEWSRSSSSRQHFEEAQALEREGKGRDAVRSYIRAARGGSGPAARRLYEIYLRGIVGVMPDYAEALKWNNAARVLGEEIALPADPLRAEQEARRAAEAAKRDAEKAAGLPSHDALYQQGQALEKEGRTAAAVRAYIKAARAGSSDAARRLGEIVDEGKAQPDLPHPDLAPMVPRAQVQPRFYGEPYRPDDPIPGGGAFAKPRQ